MASPSLAHPPMTLPLSCFMINFMQSPWPSQPLVFCTSAIFLQDPRAGLTLTHQDSSNFGLTAVYDTRLPEPCHLCLSLHHDKWRLQFTSSLCQCRPLLSNTHLPLSHLTWQRSLNLTSRLRPASAYSGRYSDFTPASSQCGQMSPSSGTLSEKFPH